MLNRVNNNLPIVSITGMGVITPCGLGIEQLWKSCLIKQSIIEEGLGTVKENFIQEMNSKIMASPWIKSFSKINSKSLQMTVYAISEALIQCQWESFNEDDLIIIGTTTGQISIWENELLSYSQGLSPNSKGKISLCKQSLSSLSEDLKNIFSFPGRIIIVASACSASTQAITIANEMLLSKRAKRCLAGGVEELSKLTISGFNCLKLLNQNLCKPFDQNRMGINLSEGAAFYSFELASNKPVLAHVVSGSTVLDSYHMTAPNPKGEGMQKAILAALNKAQIKPEEISFVHAHGTGSSHNDLAESYAIAQIFPHRPPVVSTKGVHGHALGASGSLELGICIKVLQQKIIPPVTGLETIDENITLNLPRNKQNSAVTFLLKTTLGFGGVNSTFILKAANHA